MKKIILFSFLFIILFSSVSFSGENNKRLSYLELRDKMLSVKESKAVDFNFDLSGRKINGLIYSVLVPGTGQYYLGHEIKGVAFTILSAGSMVTTVISQNNLVAMNERLESLETDYAKANTYTKADEIWVKMVQAKNDADSYSKTKNLFIGVYAGLWILNIVDYLFLSPDKGSKEFSMKKEQDIRFDLGMIQKSPTISLSFNF
jgi:hypothetical protein